MAPRLSVLSKVPKAVLDKIHAAKTLRLDLGCGPNKQPGTFGVDARPCTGVDLVWDLEDFPWPLPDDIARVVFMSHFWEHISPKKTMGFMAELHRVCQHDAQVLIAAPYGMEFRFVQDPTHCFGPETEVLTDRGFRRFEDVQVGDRCLVLDPTTQTTTVSAVTRVIAQPYVGHLLHFQTKRLDLLVTPNHDLLSSAVGRGPGVLTRHRADALTALRGHHSRRGLATIADWRGEAHAAWAPSYWSIPRVPRGWHNAAKKMPVQFPTDAFVRFMGWYLAEGSLEGPPPRYVVQIHQSREANPAKFAEIVSIVRALGLTPQEADDGVRCSSKGLWTYLQPLGLSATKYVPYELKQLARPLLELLLDALVKGDGSRNGRGFDYASVSPQLAADVQEIALKCGYRALVYAEPRAVQQVIRGRVVTCRPEIHRVSVQPAADVYYPRPKLVPFAGTVRCVTVAEHHTLLVRRNGRAVWAGNCNPTNEATFAYWDNLHPSGLWHVYTPPVFHLETFDIFPAGMSRDFNAILRCCKAGSGKTCEHLTVVPAPAGAKGGRIERSTTRSSGSADGVSSIVPADRLRTRKKAKKR